MTLFPAPLRRFVFDCGSRDVAVAPALVFLRVTVGAMMLFGHGLPKLQKYSALKGGWHVPDFFPLSLMSPEVSLCATLLAELVAPVLLVVGLATRPAAFVFSFAMVVAAFDVGYHQVWFALPPTGKELAVMYLLPGVALLLSGAGGWSLDALLHREPKRRRW